jgi:hypothetical protein
VTLGDLLAELDRLDPELTIFVDASPDDWTSASNAILLREDVNDDDSRPPSGWHYFLEVFIAREVAQDWAKYRERELSTAEVVDVVMHYARWDAYPLDDRPHTP